ncbi:HAD-IIB family hydrolase [Cribrihabitans neustonicus]|uniref:HAD-IIB family hydrolase n=1 Tax=Cribrihabitans neustonicus TaxID=1429085 RepID=UPI003B5A3C05
MHILHIALGGCLTAPLVRYGITEDTGGHIAYVLGAAYAQAARQDVTQVDIVTRAFRGAGFDPIHSCPLQKVAAKINIRRLSGRTPAYAAKEALTAEMPALREAFLAELRGMARKPDVIHAHFADAAELAAAARAVFGIPFVYTPHSLAIGKKDHAGAKEDLAFLTRIAQETAALRHADATIVSSRDEAERQVVAYDAGAEALVHQIAPGVTRLPGTADEGTADAEALIAPFLDQPEKPMVLAIARPVRRKNLGLLAAAYAASPALHQRANLVILAGQQVDGIATAAESRAVLEELHAAAALPEVQGRIALPAEHGPEIVHQMYRLAAKRRGVFVNPALHEPFGLTLLEAAVHGLPVVATREGGPSDIVGRLQNGRLADPGDAVRLAAAAAELLQDREAWDKASRNGLAAREVYNWDNWAAGAMRTYRLVSAPLRAIARPAAPMLISDLDNTLTGCRKGTRAFSDWLTRSGMRFAIATGRSITQARRVLAEWDLPEPEAFITAVGTEIHVRGRSGRLQLCKSFARRINADWQRSALEAEIRKLGAKWQPDIEQRRWKLSLFGSAKEAERLRAAFHDADLSAKVVHSHGNLIDVIPVQAGKDRAASCLADELGIARNALIAAGDSGNDSDLLRNCRRAILVANAAPEIARLAELPNVYWSHKRHAQGVLEGLSRWRAGSAERRPPTSPVTEGAKV